MLGGRGELESGHLRSFVDTYGYVIFGVDFVGMAGEDQLVIGSTLLSGDMAGFNGTVERNHQGMLNSLLAMRE